MEITITKENTLAKAKAQVKQEAGLYKSERCAQFTNVGPRIAVLRKHLQRSFQYSLFRAVCHNILHI